MGIQTDIAEKPRAKGEHKKTASLRLFRTGRVLGQGRSRAQKFYIRTAFKLCRTLGQVFNKPKHRPQQELQRTGIVNKLR